MTQSRSTDQPALQHFVCGPLMMVLLLAAGCVEVPSSVVSISKATIASADSTVMPEASAPAIDVGIVLAERSGYFCVPLQQVGLPPETRIVSFESSCDCIQPRLIHFIADGREIRPAILLEYAVDRVSGVNSVHEGENQAVAANLGVTITVALDGGDSHNFIVNLMHTMEAERVVLLNGDN